MQCHSPIYYQLTKRHLFVANKLKEQRTAEEYRTFGTKKEMSHTELNFFSNNENRLILCMSWIVNITVNITLKMISTT